MESRRSAEAEQLADDLPIDVPVCARGIFILVEQQEAGCCDCQRTEIRDGVCDSRSENAQCGKPAFSEDQQVVQRYVDETADDLYLCHERGPAASGEKGKERGFHAGKPGTGCHSGEIFDFKIGDLRIMTVMQNDPFSAERQQKDEEPGDGGAEIEAVPCGAHTALPVSGTVIL